MANFYVGEAIQKIRKEKNLTQEELAEGICSVSTISKIENGSQMPTRRTFELLMQRLGETGFSYSNFYDSRQLQISRLQKDIFLAIEFQQFYQMEEKIWVLSQLIDRKNHREQQLMCVIQLLWQQVNKVALLDAKKQWERALCLTKEDYVKQLKTKNATITWLELMCINNYALTCIRLGQNHIGLEILLRLYQNYGYNQRAQHHYYKRKAGICGNLAWCLMNLQMINDATYYINLALRQVVKDATALMALKLLRIRMEIEKYQCDMDAYYQDYVFAKNLFDMLPKEDVNEETFEKFLASEKELVVF